MPAEPLPFHLPLPGRDTLGLDGARSESYRVHGLLHCDGETLTFEWSGSAHVEHVSLLGIDIDDQVSPPELWDVPVSLIAEVRITGGWGAPRLHLRARRIDAFDGIPGAKPGTISLRFRRRDRALAAALVDALEQPSGRPAIQPSSHRISP
ncbi:MAG: hypothetical protein ACREMH_09935 [Gemmatimonadales bacterium]